VLARLIVYRDLDLVCLVDVEVVYLVHPAVVPRRLSAALDRIFDLDVDKRLWASTKAPSSRVVHIGDRMNAQGEVATQRLSLAGDVQTVICGAVNIGRTFCRT
jgi:hypothetical protein